MFKFAFKHLFEKKKVKKNEDFEGRSQNNKERRSDSYYKVGNDK